MKLFSTSCETLFLGWDAPLLPRAAQTLRLRFANRHKLDLSSLICVLPSARAAARLETLVHVEAHSHDLQYIPPDVVTIGQLAEKLYRPSRPVALELEQTLAWARVLRATHPDDLQPLIPSVPAAQPIGPWLELAGSIRRLHEELSASRLTFGDVIDVAATDAEKRRWKLLATLLAAYSDRLAEAGLVDPHQARREAVLQERCQTDRTVVLIGTSDISDALVAMLRCLDSDLISMVAAPPTEAFRFDEFGCVDTDGWTDHHLPLLDDQLVSAGDIADQATAVAETLADLSEYFSPDQVTVGVTDESHVAPVEVRLRGSGVSTFRHLGWTVAETAIGRLLDLTATHLHRRTWQSLAALVRHADVCELVTRRIGAEESGSWLTQLDQLLSEYFPVHVGDPVSPLGARECPLAIAVAEFVQQWLAEFAGPDRSIAGWSGVLDEWLKELYADRLEAEQQQHPPARPGRTMTALHAAHRMVGRLVGLNDRLDVTVSGGAAIEMLAARLADVRIMDQAKPEDVDILGWLDLALDDAPAMVVVGLNHPFVPAAVTSDPFLPGRLRSRLRMADNQRRFARDVYAMHVMLTSRGPSDSDRRAIRFIVGNSGADQSPTPPSRLLAAAPTRDAARRVRSLLGGRRPPVVVHHRWDEGPDKGMIPIPSLPETEHQGRSVSVENLGEQIRTMSVTAFGDYLACPYRFYLRHVLKLKPLDDAASELAANQFGSLVHGSLEEFGRSPDRDESDPAKIEAMLIQHLHDYAAQHFGDTYSTAVQLQIAQARRRLQVVARQQAARIAAGWKIHASEASIDEQCGAGIDVDGRWMGLRARLDRIDFHQPTGRWAILDYKTHGHRPEKKHLRWTDDGYQWIDLQLPLYRMMIPFLGIDAPASQVQLGYFNVAEKDEETRINIAEFTDQQMQSAEDLIRDCVRSIWAGEFAPTGDRVPFDDYGMILQTGVASRLLDQAEQMIGEEVEA